MSRFYLIRRLRSVVFKRFIGGCEFKKDCLCAKDSFACNDSIECRYCGIYKDRKKADAEI